MEGVQLLDLASLAVQHPLVDGVGHAVVDELGQDQAVAARIEHLEGVEGEGQEVANIGIAGEDCVDVGGEGSALVLVDGVLRAGGGASDGDAAGLGLRAAADAAFAGV